MIQLVRRFRSLNSTDRRVVLEAVALLALTSVGLHLFRFQTLRRTLTFRPRPLTRQSLAPRGAESSTNAVARVTWGVTAAATRFPVSTSCLVRALAADAMLRHRGFASEVRFGVRKRGDRVSPLEAHAWVECDGEVVLGEIESLPDYAILIS